VDEALGSSVFELLVVPGLGLLESCEAILGRKGNRLVRESLQALVPVSVLLPNKKRLGSVAKLKIKAWLVILAPIEEGFRSVGLVEGLKRNLLYGMPTWPSSSWGRSASSSTGTFGSRPGTTVFHPRRSRWGLVRLPIFLFRSSRFVMSSSLSPSSNQLRHNQRMNLPSSIRKQAKRAVSNIAILQRA
jgi:hypothetical protein